MRILLIASRYYPESFSITHFAEKLVSFGHEVTVLTGRPWSGKFKIYEGYEKVKTELINGVKVLRVKEFPRSKKRFSIIFNYFSIHKRYKKALRKLKCEFDIVFSHVLSPIFSISYVSKYCKKYNLPHFHYCFDLWPESLIATSILKRNTFLYKLMKKYCVNIYNKMDMITYASPSCKAYFKEYLKIDKPFELIYQPCLSDLPPRSVVENHNYKFDGKVHLLFCGTIAKFTHLDLLLEALSLDEFKEKIEFDIVGNGSLKDKVEETVKKHSMNNVHFHGHVNVCDTKEFLYKADCFVVPLFNNSYTSLMIPQKINESLMYCRPIFGMIEGDGRHVLEEASSLNLISGQTIDELRQKFRKLIDMSTEDMLKCGKDNRAYFENKKDMSLDFAAKKLENCLFKVLEENKL